MSLADMQKAERDGYLCAVCQGRLTVAHGGYFGINSYILRCGNDINHTGITRHDKKYEEKIRRSLSMDSTSLTKLDEKTMLQRVEMARFPQELTLQDKKLLSQVAITYGFDPLMGEVTIYQGKPYVSIDGRYRKAQETGNLDGVETRPANKQERADWEIPNGDYFFRSEVWVKGSLRPIVAWGRVFGAETTINKPGDAYKPVVKNPQRMAEKRAEAQALRKGFHIPLPSIEDIESPDYDTEGTARIVDKETGEITEGKELSKAIEGTIVAPPVKKEPDKQPEPTPDAPKPIEKPAAKQTSVTPQQEFMTWVSSHGKKFTSSWVCETLSIKTVTEIKDFEKAKQDLKSLCEWEK